jgi:hypothetical protein
MIHSADLTEEAERGKKDTHTSIQTWRKKGKKTHTYINIHVEKRKKETHTHQCTRGEKKEKKTHTYINIHVEKRKKETHTHQCTRGEKRRLDFARVGFLFNWLLGGVCQRTVSHFFLKFYTQVKMLHSFIPG